MRKIVILLAVAAFVLPSCGGKSKSASSDTPVKLSGTTTDKGTKDVTNGARIGIRLEDFAFNPTFLKAGPPGRTVTLLLKNEGTVPHTFTSAALGVDQTLAPKQSMDVQVTLPQSGATEFHCTFHQQSNGMQGAFFYTEGDKVGPANAPPASASSSSPSAGSSSSSSGGYYGN